MHIKFLMITVCMWCLSCSIVLSSGCKKVEIPKDAIILGETTVAQVNGYSVGSSNYFKRLDAKGEKRPGIQISIWKSTAGSDDKSGTISVIVFEGDEFDIGNRTYKLLLVDEGKNDIGKAYLMPIEKKIRKCLNY